MLQQTSVARGALPPSMHAAWTLDAWPAVFWQANSAKGPRFVHLETHVASRRGGRRPLSGNTVWVSRCDDGDVAIGWDWVEIGDGILALVDPMSLTTNIQLVSDDGVVLPPTSAALRLNQFVRRLPWQVQVQKALKSRAY